MARSLNGTSDLIKATGAQVFGNTRAAASMACWVKGSAQQDKVFMMDGRNASQGNVRLGSENAVGGTKCRALWSNSGGTNVVDATSTAVIMDGAWHHVCFTIDASGNWKLYIDGVLDQSGGPLASNSVTLAWTAFGCNARNTNAQFFSGQVAHGANWSRQVSAKEVASLAAGMLPSHLGADHYWPLLGVDSPEPDIGGATKAGGTLTGTSAANGPPTSKGILRMAA